MAVDGVAGVTAEHKGDTGVHPNKVVVTCSCPEAAVRRAITMLDAGRGKVRGSVHATDISSSRPLLLLLSFPLHLSSPLLSCSLRSLRPTAWRGSIRSSPAHRRAPRCQTRPTSTPSHAFARLLTPSIAFSGAQLGRRARLHDVCVPRAPALQPGSALRAAQALAAAHQGAQPPRAGGRAGRPRQRAGRAWQGRALRGRAAQQGHGVARCGAAARRVGKTTGRARDRPALLLLLLLLLLQASAPLRSALRF